MKVSLIHNGNTIVTIELNPEHQTHWVIGRAADCDIKVNSLLFSRKHCTIIYLPNENQYKILDGLIGSKKSNNGIFFNNIRIRGKEIDIGDIIQLVDNYILEISNGKRRINTADFDTQS